jgi:hypothetical protein
MRTARTRNDTKRRGKKEDAAFFKFMGPLRLKNATRKFTGSVVKHFTIGRSHWLLVKDVRIEKEIW